jgi:predicted HTH transcriptional regulator
VNAQEEERVVQQIRNVVQNRVDPLVIPSLKYFETEGKKVLRISVPLGDRPPYLGHGIVYRRVVAADVPAKADDIRRMR